MNKVLWVLQVLLALVFAMSGYMKGFTPIEELTAQMLWPGRVPEWAVRTAATAELLAVLGLILPSVTRIKPILTPVAASGLVVVMLLAAVFVHVPAGETQGVVVNAVLGSLAAFVAYGRFKLAPIAPK